MKRLAVPLFVLPLLVVAVLFAADALPAVAAAALIFWIFVSIPLGIVTVLDWFRGETPRHPAGRVLHAAVRVPVLLLGIVAVVIGVAVCGWIAYAVLQRPADVSQLSRATRAVLPMVAVAGFGWYLIRLALHPRPFQSEDPARPLLEDEAEGNRLDAGET